MTKKFELFSAPFIAWFWVSLPLILMILSLSNGSFHGEMSIFWNFQLSFWFRSL